MQKIDPKLVQALRDAIQAAVKKIESKACCVTATVEFNFGGSVDYSLVYVPDPGRFPSRVTLQNRDSVPCVPWLAEEVLLPAISGALPGLAIEVEEASKELDEMERTFQAAIDELNDWIRPPAF